MRQEAETPEELNEKELMAAFAELSAATAQFEEASLVGDAVRLAVTRIRLEKAVRCVMGESDFLRCVFEQRFQTKLNA